MAGIRNPVTRLRSASTAKAQGRGKPDGVLTKKMNGKTFATKIYFDKKSKDTFQGKLLKVVQADKRLESK